MEYEDRITISTPEGLELEYDLAGLGSRFLASLVDLVIRLAVLVALILVLHFAHVGNAAAKITLSVAGFIAVFVYDVAFEVWGAGRTPGKRWTGLRVLRDGRPADLLCRQRGPQPDADHRHLHHGDGRRDRLDPGDQARPAAGRPGRRDDRGQGAERERPGAVDREPRPAGRAAPAASALARPGVDLTGITPADLALVRDFLARRDGLTAAARIRVAETLAEQMRPKVGGVDIPAHRPEELLELIAAGKYRER